MLLKASLKNGDWNLVKEIMRFISSIDPADFENGDVFDFQTSEHQSPTSNPASNNGTPNNFTPVNYKLNKSTPNNSTARNSISQSTPLVKKADVTPKTINNSTSSVASASGRQRISLNEIELSRKSIESTVHEYALELLKSYRVRRLFEMFSQLGFLNITKWLEQYQLVIRDFFRLFPFNLFIFKGQHL